MEFLDAVDKGLGVVAFLAFLKLVFGDLQEIKATMKQIEKHLAIEVELSAQARARKKEEVRNGR